MKSVRFLRPVAFIVAALVQAGAAAQTVPENDNRMHLVALRKPVIAAEITARVTTVNYRPGQPFKSGAVLVGFDCAMYEARFARAQAQRDRAERQHAALQRLDRSGATSRLEVGLAAAEMAAAVAEVRAAEISVQRCVIPAPFSGQVVDLRVQAGEFVTEGQAVLEIIDDGDLEFEGIIPSKWLAWLREGATFQADMHELALTVAARVTRISPLIDPVSQTVKVFARPEPGGPPLKAGMGAVVRFQPPAGYY
jgi:membrane fusion protein, multidrug efflux system